MLTTVRLRWSPERQEWQYSLAETGGNRATSRTPWAPLNAEAPFAEDDYGAAALDARRAFGYRTRKVTFAGTRHEREHPCYDEGVTL